MKTLVLAAAVAVMPGLAQAAGCQAAFGKLVDLLVASDVIAEPPTALVRERPGGWCGVRALRVKLDRRRNLAIEELAWRGEGLDRFVSSDLPPTALEFEAVGARVALGIGDPELDEDIAMAMLAKEGIDVGFSSAWDQAARQLILRKLEFQKSSGDEVRLNAMIDNIDLTSIASVQMSAGAMALSSFSLSVDTVDAFIPFFSGLSDADPEELEGLLSRLSEETMDENSRDAVRLLAENGPIGKLKVNFEADGGFSSARFLPYIVGGAPPDLSSILDGVVLDISFSPH